MNFRRFRKFSTADKAACLSILDKNTPTFFASNERQEYLTFLDSDPSGYWVYQRSNTILGAYGISLEGPEQARINWVMIDPEYQGRGVGRLMVSNAITKANQLGAVALLIAASHLSAPFFQRLGAEPEAFVQHGWGNHMHRVDMRLAL